MVLVLAHSEKQSWVSLAGGALLLWSCSLGDNGLGPTVVGGAPSTAARDGSGHPGDARPDAAAIDAVILPPEIGTIVTSIDVDAAELVDASPPGRPDGPPDLAVDPPPVVVDPPPAVVVRIHVNGSAVDGVDHPGHWAGDPGMGGVCGPSGYRNDAAIAGTSDDALFQTEMYGRPLTCAVGGLPRGLYHVNLLFAEIFWGPGCPGGGLGKGARVFDIAIEGQTVATGVDIYSEAGCAASTTRSGGHPVVKAFMATVTDGTLHLRLDGRVDEAKISAIEVLSAF